MREDVKEIKEHYQGEDVRIDILLDYIQGLEEEVQSFYGEWGFSPDRVGRIIVENDLLKEALDQIRHYSLVEGQDWNSGYVRLKDIAGRTWEKVRR